MRDDEFLDHVADALFALDGVVAVALGGSRARGTHRPDSDWDFGLYYRGEFHPQQVRDVGWEGDVVELGEWGAQNGGAWLRIDGRKTDVLFRDFDVVEHELAEARAGRFRREQLLFYLAGVPSYFRVAELALNQVLRGDLPRPEFPVALRTSAPPAWDEKAEFMLAYARDQIAPRGEVAECVAMLVTAAICTAHAVLAERGEWCVNEKRMLDRAGLRGIDEILLELQSGTSDLARSVSDVAQLCRITREAG